VADRPSTKLLLRVLAGEQTATPPIWLMRQAGRYLPEYRAIRERRKSFLELCLDPKLTTEITLQPIRRFDFDAAILFSDILIVPHALGQQVSFEIGEGPRLDALDSPLALSRLDDRLDEGKLSAVYEAIERVKAQLPPKVALLGFCGAPWTVATYMIAGFGAVDQIPARRFAYSYPDAFGRLIDRLADASTSYLIGQFKAGIDAAQIFDTWAGVLPPQEFDQWCVEPCKKIVRALRERIPEAKIIGFPRGAGTKLERYIEKVPIDAVGLDWMIDFDFGRQIQKRRPVQGNLDPLALIAGGNVLDCAIDRILEAFGGAPFIFNLGHGVLPETPIAHVEQLVARVRRWSGGA
jgi:uroporphyrinogen decarboxylase